MDIVDDTIAADRHAQDRPDEFRRFFLIEAGQRPDSRERAVVLVVERNLESASFEIPVRARRAGDARRKYGEVWTGRDLAAKTDMMTFHSSGNCVS